MSRNLQLLIAAFIAIAILAVILNAPSTVPMSPLNTGPNGLSILASKTYEIMPNIEGLGEKVCGNVIVIPVSRGLNVDEITKLKKLFQCGSTIILLDNEGYTSDLPNQLGIVVAYGDGTVLDEIYNYNDRWHPIAILKLGEEKTSIILENPRPITVTVSKGILAKGETSEFSYIDSNNDGYYSIGEQAGNTTVLFYYKYGNGTIVFISSLSVFNNKLIQSNMDFLDKIADDKNIFLYTGALKLGGIEEFRIQLYQRVHSIDRNVLSITLYLLSIPLLFVVRRGEPIERGKYVDLMVFSAASLIVFTIPLAVGNILMPIVLGTATELILVLSIFRRYGFSMYGILGLSLALSIYPELLVYSVILILVSYPLFLSRPLEREYVFIGPSSSSYIRTLISMSIFSPVTPLFLVVITTGVFFSLLLSAKYYRGLSTIKIRILKAPTTLIVNESENIVLIPSQESRFYIRVAGRWILKEGLDFNKYVFIPVKFNTVGRHVVDVKVYALDKYYISGRLVWFRRLLVTVVPFTLERLEVLKKEATRRGLIKDTVSLISGGITIYGGGSSPRTISISEITHETIRRITEIISRAIESPVRLLLESVLTTMLSHTYTQRTSKFGEYKGVRYYIPGDSPRLIHWKKSVSQNMLVTKEYELQETREKDTTGKNSGRIPILICFLDSANNRELEKTIYMLLNILFIQASKNPRSRVILLLVSSNTITSLHSSASDLLTLLIKSLEKALPHIIYEYDSITPERIETAPELFIRKKQTIPRPLYAIASSLSNLITSIHHVVVDSDFKPPYLYTIIGGRSCMVRAEYLKRLLEPLKYVYFDPETLINVTTRVSGRTDDA